MKYCKKNYLYYWFGHGLALTTLALLEMALAEIRTPVGGIGPVVLSDGTHPGGIRADPFVDTIFGQTYVIDATVGEPAPVQMISVADATGPVQRPGFIGSLFEVQSLVLEANPNPVQAGQSAVLVLAATLDDGSVIRVDPRVVGWAKTGPVGEVDDSSTEASVMADAEAGGQSATISGTFLAPTPGEVTLAILADGISGLASSWTALYGVTEFDPLADGDKDGIKDVLEAALNLNPNSSDGADAVVIGAHEESGKRYLQVRYRRHTGHTAITLAPELATDLGGLPENWSGAELVPVGAPDPIDADTEWVTVRSSVPMGDRAREFIRLRATYTPSAP